MSNVITEFTGIFTCLLPGCAPGEGCCEYCTRPLNGFRKTKHSKENSYYYAVQENE